MSAVDAVASAMPSEYVFILSSFAHPLSIPSPSLTLLNRIPENGLEEPQPGRNDEWHWGKHCCVGTALSLYMCWHTRKKDKKEKGKGKKEEVAVVAAEQGGIPGAPPVSFWKMMAF